MTKSLSVCACFFFICLGSVFAQKRTESHWGKTGYDIAYSAAATDDGGYIMCGLTKSDGDSIGDIVVIKTALSGDTSWTFTLGGPKLEGGNFVMQTADGGYLVAGHCEDFGAQDCDGFLMKLDKKGNRKMFKVYGGLNDDIFEGAVEMPDGSFVFAGITASYGNPDNSQRRHTWFVKTSSTGDLIWSKFYAWSGHEYGYSIASMTNGGYLAVGYKSQVPVFNGYRNGGYDGQIMRLNENGDMLWTRLYHKEGVTIFYKILPSQDNGFYLAGFTTLTVQGPTSGLLVKLDADGNELWEKLYGDEHNSIIFNDIKQLPNGNLMFAGSSTEVDSPGDVYILTTDANGNKINDELCGGSNSSGSSVAVQGNNGYLVAGISSKYGDPNGDIYYIIKDNTVLNVPSTEVVLPHIFPNPVKDRSAIVLPAPESYSTVDMDVRDMSGKLIYSLKNVMAKDIVINKGSLPPAEYLYRIMCKDGKEYKGKFVVE